MVSPSSNIPNVLNSLSLSRSLSGHWWQLALKLTTLIAFAVPGIMQDIAWTTLVWNHFTHTYPICKETSKANLAHLHKPSSKTTAAKVSHYWPWQRGLETHVFWKLIIIRKCWWLHNWPMRSHLTKFYDPSRDLISFQQTKYKHYNGACGEEMKYKKALTDY